jgi:hypothetical protein
MEVLSKVKLLQISISHSKDSQFEFTKTHLIFNNLKIKLNLQIIPHSVKIQTYQNTIEFSVDILEESLQISQLPLEKPDSICCGACLIPLVDRKTFISIAPLPSEYWHELLECWACHHEDYSTLKGQEGGRILAKPKVILDGNGYFLIDPNDLLPNVVRLNYNGREVCMFIIYFILYFREVKKASKASFFRLPIQTSNIN